ncbi:MAG: sigma factor-like helix-turn-helix DNA-binding protein [Mangrovibacterium sp.]|nr:sigma factor-like helix-turn-helix DNA-binding protein [Mangrovibacterium sp.]
MKFGLIDQLPEKRRAIFKLNRLDGLTNKEITVSLMLKTTEQ